jgi:predicted RNA methylase
VINHGSQPLSHSEALSTDFESLSITEIPLRHAPGSAPFIEYGTGTTGPEPARSENEGEDGSDDEDENVIQKHALNGYVENYPTVPAQKASNQDKFDNSRLKSGESVAIKDGAEPAFMRIRDVYTKPNGQLFIRGLKLVQRGHPLTLLEHREGELVVFVQAPDAPDVEYRAASATHYVDIIFTNQNYDRLNRSQVSMPNLTRYSYNILNQIYFCRWKCFLPSMGHVFPDSSPPRDLSRHPSGLIARLAEDEVDDMNWSSGRLGVNAPSKTPDHVLRSQWQQGATSSPIHGKYTFGDAFAGAGGTSLGAYNAGLALTWAFDSDAYATQTYEENFTHTGVRILKKHVDAFVEQVQRLKRNVDTYYVDSLHLSPPCQPYSSANNTRKSRRDVKNCEAFDKIPEVVKVIQPRIITLEEIFAFESYKTNRKSFRELISMFVELGYSTSWRIMHLWQYGVPQTRKRLILIAAA